jgi:hypothetical protein
MSRPSDNMQPTSKRRPGQQLTKDDVDDDDDEEGGVRAAGGTPLMVIWVAVAVAPPTSLLSPPLMQGVEPGTWGKADTPTMARRKVIKVARRGAPPEPTAAAAAADNPFAGVSLTAPAAAAANPFAGAPLLAPTLEQQAKVGVHTPVVSCERTASFGVRDLCVRLHTYPHAVCACVLLAG